MISGPETTFLGFMATLFIWGVGLLLVLLAGMYVLDRSQTADAIRHNFPVIGRFRGLFTQLGEFFRQYFFAMDREEMPFNRAERDWVYRASRDQPDTVAFGSTRDLKLPGTVIFANCPFPTLDQEAAETRPVTLGEGCRHPYTTRSLFNISGMSFGAISKPAVLALSNGARMAGCWMNTGEGGLSKYHLEGGADLVFQIGTAKYGVRNENGGLDEDKLRKVAAHEQVKMFEIKMSQGAKPGKGGILPAVKVTPEIARVRGIPAYEASISPNRHPEIDSPSDLLDMIAKVREITGKPTGFKAVMGGYRWLDALFGEIRKRGIDSAPDFITIDSGDGGTGAAPMSLIDNVGLPIRESLPVVVDLLVKAGLRDRIKVICSGKMITPVGVAWAFCVGADFVVSARGFMFALGCIQALKCNRDTCPTGITTHNPKLQTGLDPEIKANRVAAYAKNITHEVGVIAHSCGVHEPRQFKRRHARIVMSSGQSVPLDELYPG